LSFRRFNYVLIVFALLLGAHQHLTAVDHHVNIGTLAVLGARVIANDDRAVWSDDHSRAVRHADASAPVGLRLHGVAGIELNVIISDYDLSRGRAHHTNVTFERHEARTCQRGGMEGHSFE